MRVGRWLSFIAALLLVAFGAWAARAEEPVIIPPPAIDVAMPLSSGIQTAVLAGGCFWGVQAVYQHTEGVLSAVSGYSGGTKDTAKYDIVSAGGSRHAESVEVKFDPKKISYGRILQIFFSVVHDPTELDRQGPDEGPHYRSNIFYADAEQQRVAEAYIRQLDALKAWPAKIVTRVDRLEAFYPAEDYHQDFAMRNPFHPYIFFNDLPKITNLKKVFADRYRNNPVLVADKK